MILVFCSGAAERRARLGAAQLAGAGHLVGPPDGESSEWWRREAAASSAARWRVGSAARRARGERRRPGLRQAALRDGGGLGQQQAVPASSGGGSSPWRAAAGASSGRSDLRRAVAGRPVASGNGTARGELRPGEQRRVRLAASITAVASSGRRRLLGAKQIIWFSYPLLSYGIVLVAVCLWYCDSAVFS